MRKGKVVLDFFNWAYDKGGKQAEALDYAILPQEVVTAVRAAWKIEVKDSQAVSVV